MNAWTPLTDELDLWAAAEKTATFWWRDDDAGPRGDRLDLLFAEADRAGAPVSLAVIPAEAGSALADAVSAAPVAVIVLQHGIAHQNRAAPGAKKIEVGVDRRTEVVLGDLASGREQLARLFGAQLLPVLVPPWNRIAESLVPLLPEIGYCGLSRFGPRTRAEPAPGLVEVNVHIDPVDWKARAADPVTCDTARPPLEIERVVALAVDQLRARRGGAADADEPTGLVTHHRVHQAATWNIVRAFADIVRDHPAAAWLDAARCFGR